MHITRSLEQGQDSALPAALFISGFSQNLSQDVLVGLAVSYLSPPLFHVLPEQGGAFLVTAKTYVHSFNLLHLFFVEGSSAYMTCHRALHRDLIDTGLERVSSAM